jgi:expansin (peptidoglycan-binding protein)
MKRESYNYFVEASGTGPAPVKLRVTASTGETLEDTLPDLVAEKEYAGRAQFR